MFAGLTARVATAVARRTIARYPSVGATLAPVGSVRRSGFERITSRPLANDPTLPKLPYPEGTPPLPAFNHCEDPAATLVVSSYESVNHTIRCLASIARARTALPFEVIVVDDASSPAVRDRLRGVSGIRLLELPQNVGYLRATNAGIKLARSRYVVLLNNDVQVTDGWLDAMVGRCRSSADIAVVGARLVYPNGSLQEAGSIVFNDGSAWNYGNGTCPTSPEVQHTRDVDYCSAACLLIDSERVQPMFDDHFAPAYYEDVDLCFAARRDGFRVVYEPSAVAYHDEGTSHGTDVTTGLKQYQAINQKRLTTKWREELATHQPPGKASVGRARYHGARGHVLVVDHRVPTPDRDAGSLRMVHLLEAIQVAGFAVHFVPHDHLLVPEYTESLRARGIEVIGSVREALLLVGSDLSLAILSRPPVARTHIRRIRRASPNAAIVYDMVDLHALRDQRMRSIGAPSSNRRLQRQVAQNENWSMSHADAVIAVSEVEAEHVRQHHPNRRVFVLPTVHDADSSVVSNWAQRSGLLFVGSFEHLPNVDAAEQIVRLLAPEWAETLPGVEISIVGQDPPAPLVDEAPPNVRFLGWVPDLEALYKQNRLAIAPLRAGAGVKGKVCEAMAHSTPVITTPIGIEGIGATDGQEVVIAADTQEFAEAARRIYCDEVMWRRISAGGHALVAREFSRSAAQHRMEILLDELLPLGRGSRSA